VDWPPGAARCPLLTAASPRQKGRGAPGPSAQELLRGGCIKLQRAIYFVIHTSSCTLGVPCSPSPLARNSRWSADEFAKVALTQPYLISEWADHARGKRG
jgi:hypothetical protein